MKSDLKELIEENGPMTLEEAAEILGKKETTMKGWAIELEREGKISRYNNKGRMGSTLKYNKSDLIHRDYIKKQVLFIHPERFAEFFEKKVLKVALSNDMPKGLKRAVTAHIRNNLPHETVKRLKTKYVKDEPPKERFLSLYEKI
ncbi:hypothetical protein AKJ66_02860 [candidate division MSBL1 archaeon SCGC-AAA259E22]|uniref:Uncharacterized protein n=1 Tax=candidate division MSBL1 archaeon SCGC-AAA259E22 TaxID=1698265 RepID=A0A133UFR1_9EURY|nr:hypothetical protein AKJ66_02860 [candidate division MSBL1 archaeon SCGC-AAA259E22]